VAHESLIGHHVSLDCVLFRRFLQLLSRFFQVSLDDVQPVILRLYFLIPLKKGLLELLDLDFRILGARNSSICLSAKTGKFLLFFLSHQGGG
jgi:hypothetical protein